ncbi:hypothetical protein [Streptomyces sp. AC495_CC817]|uniref:hypothetical protein n=1 Tax=Streptomyces sp. AC495_CC817 TaxID=2823900 RepID=UPI001C26B9A4|nr:hypothetical protein [Streptomyces sp. AC495_CC817]
MAVALRVTEDRNTPDVNNEWAAKWRLPSGVTEDRNLKSYIYTGPDGEVAVALPGD